MAAPPLFEEIFQETSSGDFGIQVLHTHAKVWGSGLGEVTPGPLFRCHTEILQKTPGFVGKVRQFGKMLMRTVDNKSLPTSKEFFKEMKYTRLMQDVQWQQFSLPLERSALTSALSQVVEREDPRAPSFTTAKDISGSIGAMKRRDPFFLSERYEVVCDCERMTELLRYIYKGHSVFFDQRPKSDPERESLVKKMLTLTYDAEKYSVDLLFEKLLNWFGTQCCEVCGEKAFTDAFYHLQHFAVKCTEDHSRNYLVNTVTGDMLRRRVEFCAVTRDPRWPSLPVEFVENLLSYDGMPIGTEIEVLKLIERWNANADQRKEDMLRLLFCFRPDEHTHDQLRSWLTSMGWLTTTGEVANMPDASKMIALVNGTANKKRPRRNLQGNDLEEELKELAHEELTGMDKLIEQAKEAAAYDEGTSFNQYRGATLLNQGFSFSLRAHERLVQSGAIRSSGIHRLRCVVSNPRVVLWDPEQEVFVGISFGEGKFFGYLCSATAFSGIFSVRALSSVAPAPNPPVHLTGGGNKVEFDAALEVQLKRVNRIQQMKLGVIFHGETIVEEHFQVSSDTVESGAGLRFQVVATGLGNHDISVQLAWIQGGHNDTTEKEAFPFALEY
mmetsp:Transcript_5138/g.12326  ORF Transcript_5138/g.12326 Transcript_5138/m.12326 type:complete len:612 (+) Transcript_5138:48-1883(+)